MAVKASISITISCYRDTEKITRYYKLQSSTASAPVKPITNPPSGWTDAEPSYTTASTDTLYFCDLSEFSDGTYSYSTVSKSSSYEAAKEAWNKADNAQNAADSTKDSLDEVQSSADLTESRVSTAETLIQQLSDSIATLVTDGNGESLMTQTETGWTYSIGSMQSIVNSTSENLNNLTNEMGNVNSAVNALQQAVNDLGVLNDYVKIGTYENEPCIELGESDSDFKLLITNTRIMFMEGSGVPAYLTNQSLFVKKAVVEEELQQGEFVWKARNNGNLGLIWKGAIS